MAGPRYAWKVALCLCLLGTSLLAQAQGSVRGEAQSRRGYITSSTRDPGQVAYYNSVMRRLECLGNKAYPELARGRTLSVVATLSIREDGSLENVEIDRSSGTRELDEAVLAAARQAAPYPRFTGSLRARYGVLDVTGTWRYGQVTGGPRPPTDC